MCIWCGRLTMVQTKRGLEDSERLCTMLDSMFELYKTSDAPSAKDSCQKALSTIYTSSQTQIEIEHCYPTWFKPTRNLNKQLFRLPYPLRLSHRPPAHHLLHSSPPSSPPPTGPLAPAPPELALGSARPTLGPSPPPNAGPASARLSPPAVSPLPPPPPALA